MISEPALISDGKEFKKLLSITETSTDFHFPSLENQLLFIKYEEFCHLLLTLWRKLGLENVHPSDEDHANWLCTGDFVVTKHSNLPLAQLVFHLVTGKRNGCK